MNERLVGVIEGYPYMRGIDTNELEIEGRNCNEVNIILKVKLPNNKLKRLDIISCAIRQLKVLFMEIKEEIKEDIKYEEAYASGW